MKILKIFEEKLRYKNYSEKSIKLYLSYLNFFLTQQKIKDPYQITTKQIVDFLQSKTYSSTSQQNQYIGCLKLFAKYILNKKDIHLQKIERPKAEKKLPKVIDHNHIITQLDKIQNLKHKAILSLTYSVGLRVSEITNLKIEDIDSKRMLIHIKNAKGKKDRIVPLSQNILLLLREYYSIQSCQKLYKLYIDKNSSIHTLRHSTLTHLLESGTDLRILQKLAGHNSSKTTEIYTHVSSELLSKINLPV